MMPIRLIALFVLAIISAQMCFAQDMVVSEYYNIQDENGEWTEVVVVKDNLNAVGYVVFDANTGQVARMGGPKFKDIPLWRNLRAGTIIVIWHRAIPAGVKKDVDPRDGYLEVSSRDVDLFTIFLFPTATMESAALNIANDGDVLQIVDGNEVPIHALGHNKPTGAAYNAVTAPKANFDSGSVGASRSNRITGRTLGAYGVGITKDSAVAGFNESRGLPNRFDLARTNMGVKNINHWFWRETREPIWTAAPSVNVITQNESSITIGWTPVIDGYPQDSTTGYVILRDTLNFASFPANGVIDGTIITKGTKIGTATIVDVRPTIAGNQYKDSTNIACGVAYTYRVYGYRYRRDDILTTTDDTTARGRQYTELRYAQSSQITRTTPSKPEITASKIEICPGDTLTLSTTSVVDRYEWTLNGVSLAVGGTTRVVVREAGTYRLKVYGAGCSALSDEITVKLLPAPSVDVSPVGPHTICAGDSVVLTTSANAATFEWLRDGFVLPGATTRTLVVRQAGDYQVRIATAAGCPGVSPLVRVRTYDVKLRSVPNALNFGTLGQCKSDTSLFVDVFNDGTSVLTVTNVTLPVGFALVAPPPGFQVAPGKSQRVQLAFSPSGSGVFNGAAVFSAAPCGVSTTCTVRGERNAISVAVDRSQVNFGTFASCPTSNTRVDSTFQIRNSGSDTIYVGVPRVDPPFYLLTSFTGAKALPPNQDLAIQIQYRPLGPDLDRGVIQQIAFPYTSRSCRDTLRAQIQAASYVPRIAIAPDQLDLGVVLECAAVVDTVFEVTNTSLVPVTVTNVIGNGIIYAGGSIVIDPKSTKSIPLSITPVGQSGPFSISARVQFGPCAMSDSIVISGTLLKPEYTASTQVLEFGTILLCDTTTSSTRVVSLVSRGLLGLRSRVNSVSVAQPFTSDVVTGSSFGDTLTASVTFRPTGLGVFTDTLELVVGPCSTIVKVVVRGVSASKSNTVATTATFYGTLSPGQFRDEQITVTNTGSAPIQVVGMSGVPAPFSVLSSSCVLPIVLLPGEKASTTIRYTFQGYARKDTIVVRVYTGGPCADTTSLQLTGWTVSKDTLRGLQVIAPQDLIVRAGDDVDIPLQLTSPKPLDSLGIFSMTIDLSYDPQLFKLESVPQSPPSSQISANETSPGMVRIQISSTNPIVAANPLITLRGSTYVGPTRSTPLAVDTAFATGVLIDGIDGKLTVVPDCDIDASTAGVGRPIVLRVTNVAGDAVRVAYSVLTDEQTSLMLTDMTGKTTSIELPSIRPGSHEVNVSVSELESGAYTLIYRNGRHIRTTTFIISR
jgi:hypothetical protein